MEQNYNYEAFFYNYAPIIQNKTRKVIWKVKKVHFDSMPTLRAVCNAHLPRNPLPILVTYTRHEVSYLYE